MANSNKHNQYAYQARHRVADDVETLKNDLADLGYDINDYSYESLLTLKDRLIEIGSYSSVTAKDAILSAREFADAAAEKVAEKANKAYHNVKDAKDAAGEYIDSMGSTIHSHYDNQPHVTDIAEEISKKAQDRIRWAQDEAKSVGHDAEKLYHDKIHPDNNESTFWGRLRHITGISKANEMLNSFKGYLYKPAKPIEDNLKEQYSHKVDQMKEQIHGFFGKERPSWVPDQTYHRIQDAMNTIEDSIQSLRFPKVKEGGHSFANTRSKGKFNSMLSKFLQSNQNYPVFKFLPNGELGNDGLLSVLNKPTNSLNITALYTGSYILGLFTMSLLVRYRARQHDLNSKSKPMATPTRVTTLDFYNYENFLTSFILLFSLLILEMIRIPVYLLHTVGLIMLITCLPTHLRERFRSLTGNLQLAGMGISGLLCIIYGLRVFS